jgi:hypothetical protein
MEEGNYEEDFEQPVATTNTQAEKENLLPPETAS